VPADRVSVFAERQSVATPQAARGWSHPPYKHILLSASGCGKPHTVLRNYQAHRGVGRYSRVRFAHAGRLYWCPAAESLSRLRSPAACAMRRDRLVELGAGVQADVQQHQLQQQDERARAVTARGQPHRITASPLLHGLAYRSRSPARSIYQAHSRGVQYPAYPVCARLRVASKFKNQVSPVAGPSLWPPHTSTHPYRACTEVLMDPGAPEPGTPLPGVAKSPDLQSQPAERRPHRDQARVPPGHGSFPRHT
jgi:hypothetical protein